MTSDSHLAASLRGSLSADVVEALIGAIFIDKGYAAARDFTEWLMDDAAKMRAAVLDLNFKAAPDHSPFDLLVYGATTEMSSVQQWLCPLSLMCLAGHIEGDHSTAWMGR